MLRSTADANVVFLPNRNSRLGHSACFDNRYHLSPKDIVGKADRGDEKRLVSLSWILLITVLVDGTVIFMRQTSYGGHSEVRCTAYMSVVFFTYLFVNTFYPNVCRCCCNIICCFMIGLNV